MKPKFTITNGMLNLIVDITEEITRLEIVQERNLHLRKENRIRSIQSSLAIENNTLTLEQMTDIIAGKRVLGAPKDIKEVQNAYEAYELVFNMDPYLIDDFLKSHKLMTKELIKESGKFRTSDVGVYDHDGNVVHIGTRPQFVYSHIQDLFEWARMDTIPDLIKSCVIHFEIEMIHPFADGNGRMGRLWQNLLLSKWHKVFEWIPVETIVYENQQRYYNVLQVGCKDFDSTEFIEFMLEMIYKTISTFENTVTEKMGADILSLDILEQMNEKEIEFFYSIKSYLLKHGSISNTKSSLLSGRPAVTTRRYIHKLIELGVLSPVGENKNRLYQLNSVK
ncbi:MULTISPECIES: Fic family protein [unclassified Breznakia]|uniref:Fic family protein n=1 Tax=unclassified Breznakia TaxID=2623764 RepID=UPI0024761C39|nr:MULTISPECIES: Fic family protein [unclassified Breznakia]MDH6367587.1 Fic family protein [Breznakia sp. PH1-1]MDH6404707.1 Fic family protein [Breznakia sp. PF1-11]MDH6412417.1 Fic family protein [Breznakia sp. PFB1-11]MDH6414782.1 Fic family protein [Breznakia sp. PFB1-14]MDH6417088.1 Fic family protein [Breznakia sp. PFB1-4]